MTAITPELIQQLRSETGAGIMDAKRALDESNGDLGKATELLRLAGQKVAAKKQVRAANEGWIGSYVHANGKVAALVELTCETDFVARSAEFQAFAHDLALHVAAMGPEYLDRDSIPQDVIDREERIARELAAQGGKQEAIIPKIVEGKIAAYAKENAFLEQPFVRDDTKTIRQLITEAVQRFGEHIAVRRFIRFQLS